MRDRDTGGGPGTGDTSQSLHKAAHRGRLENVRILVQHEADVNEAGPVGDKWMPFNKGTPMHYAAWSGENDIIDLLIEMGARIDLLNADGRTPAEVEHDGKRFRKERKENEGK